MISIEREFKEIRKTGDNLNYFLDGNRVSSASSI